MNKAHAEQGPTFAWAILRQKFCQPFQFYCFWLNADCCGKNRNKRQRKYFLTQWKIFWGVSVVLLVLCCFLWRAYSYYTVTVSPGRQDEQADFEFGCFNLGFGWTNVFYGRFVNEKILLYSTSAPVKMPWMGFEINHQVFNPVVYIVCCYICRCCLLFLGLHPHQVMCGDLLWPGHCQDSQGETTG